MTTAALLRQQLAEASYQAEQCYRLLVKWKAREKALADRLWELEQPITPAHEPKPLTGRRKRLSEDMDQRYAAGGRHDLIRQPRSKS